MHLKEGTEVAILVNGEWLASLRKAIVLPDEAGEPVQLMFGKVITWAENIGLWLTPDKTYTDTGIIQMFIPWHFIVTLAVVQEGQKRKFGFSQRSKDSF